MIISDLTLLVIILIILILVSAYFSSSETAMMALNRYRLKHLAARKIEVLFKHKNFWKNLID